MAPQAVISKTPNSNQIVLSAIRGVVDSVEALAENGFVVVAVELSSVLRPTIRIQSCGKCLRMINQGEAVYYSYGRRDHCGPYREGQFMLGRCRVVWTEFGN